MEFTANKSRLLRLLQTVSPGVPSRSTQQVLTGILLEAHQGSIVATAYDLEVGIQDVMLQSDGEPIHVVREGSVVLPAKPVIDILRKLSDKEIRIIVQPNYTIVIQSVGFECSLHGMNGETFPRPRLISDVPDVVMSAKRLRDMIKGTAFAVSKLGSRPILTGVYIQYNDGGLCFAATDSLRLAIQSTQIDTNQSDPFDLVVPAKSLVELMHVLPDDDTAVSITTIQTHCVFKVNTLAFHTRVIEGTFVDTARLIPQHYATEVLVHTGKLMSAIDRAAVIAPRSQEVHLSVNHEVVVIQTQSADFGILSDVLPTNRVCGMDITIAFNAKNVLEALRTIPADEVRVRITGPNQPLVLVAGDEQTIVHVISPIVTR